MKNDFADKYDDVIIIEFSKMFTKHHLEIFKDLLNKENSMFINKSFTIYYKKCDLTIY